MRKVLLTSSLLLGIPFLMVNDGGCSDSSPKQPVATVKQEQAQRATEAANSVQFNGNAEIDNIKRRLELTSKPGMIGYIVLLNQMGQPVVYESVVGKITSSTKRLTDVDRVSQFSIGGNNGGAAYVVRQNVSDDGTRGSSDAYIFYWNQDGAYRQWGTGSYLYSDQPIRLSQPPLVVTNSTPK